ncbi:phosphonate metabolism protein/1,5-bisphosphokinase (PRPP-forming) PhnN [Paracoccus sp. (in: a-proteobacteria)]|uniref:phosphonate metabolism protein/1,5-bisphosphokinase (PRPP-forming) PhnN n=1 Tax=Paracoccus sp. TaxID=267 RepID=UPI0026E10631|nr:phosphonate metabolism protein/1,5-bisphosphokinase (PRPP-forming) PhnN [Paracoccus sp. (in: a-proteobacteria)]MDO5648281.1 phosphonate metabolism protein/1,5-bisphosphokinase (PRPP-forming) PhnN [Paracoccus sp. (in: a-proteobacteria)]
MIIAVVGPSGVGKDTLIAGAMAARPDLRLVRRVITRPTAAGGEDFDGVTDPQFDARLRAGDFALHWGAHGLRYGIPRDALTGGGTVIFNGSRAALPQAVAAIPGLRVIQITAPADILAARLAARGRETQADIAARLARGADGIPAGIPHVTVMNDGTPEQGIARLLAAIYPDSGERWIR